MSSAARSRRARAALDRMSDVRRARKDLSERALGAVAARARGVPAARGRSSSIRSRTLFCNSLYGVDNANPAAGEQFVGFENYVHGVRRRPVLALARPDDPVRRRHRARRAGRRARPRAPRQQAVPRQMAGAPRPAAALGVAARVRRPDLPLVLRVPDRRRQRRPDAVRHRAARLAVRPDARDDRHLHRHRLEVVVVHGADAARRLADDPEVAVRGGRGRRRVDLAAVRRDHAADAAAGDLRRADLPHDHRDPDLRHPLRDDRRRTRAMHRDARDVHPQDDARLPRLRLRRRRWRRSCSCSRWRRRPATCATRGAARGRTEDDRIFELAQGRGLAVRDRSSPSTASSRPCGSCSRRSRPRPS